MQCVLGRYAKCSIPQASSFIMLCSNKVYFLRSSNLNVAVKNQGNGGSGSKQALINWWKYRAELSCNNLKWNTVRPSISLQPQVSNTRVTVNYDATSYIYKGDCVDYSRPI